MACMGVLCWLPESGGRRLLALSTHACLMAHCHTWAGLCSMQVMRWTRRRWPTWCWGSLRRCSAARASGKSCSRWAGCCAAALCSGPFDGSVA